MGSFSNNTSYTNQTSYSHGGVHNKAQNNSGGFGGGSTGRDKYGNRIQDNSGYVVSSYDRGSAVDSRTSRNLIKQKKTESDAKNRRLEKLMADQRIKQAALMKKSREQTARMGAARRQQITETGVKRQAAGTQSLVSRGLGNTTIQGSMVRGVQADTDRAMTGQQDLEAGRMADSFSREAGMQLGQGQFQLSGEQAMSGGLEEYIALLQQLGGGLS